MIFTRLCLWWIFRVPPLWLGKGMSLRCGGQATTLWSIFPTRTWQFSGIAKQPSIFVLDHDGRLELTFTTYTCHLSTHRHIKQLRPYAYVFLSLGSVHWHVWELWHGDSEWHDHSRAHGGQQCPGLWRQLGFGPGIWDNKISGQKDTAVVIQDHTLSWNTVSLKQRVIISYLCENNKLPLEAIWRQLA